MNLLKIYMLISGVMGMSSLGIWGLGQVFEEGQPFEIVMGIVVILFLALTSVYIIWDIERQ